MPKDALVIRINIYMLHSNFALFEIMAS